jgi:hypothetical protein
VCLHTLSELALGNTELVSSCNGVRTIVDGILDPELSDLASSLTLTLLFLLDRARTRKHLRSTTAAWGVGLPTAATTVTAPSPPPPPTLTLNESFAAAAASSPHLNGSGNVASPRRAAPPLSASSSSSSSSSRSQTEFPSVFNPPPTFAGSATASVSRRSVGDTGVDDARGGMNGAAKHAAATVSSSVSSGEVLKIFSVFTDTLSPQTPEKDLRLAAAHRAVVTIMRSWTGVLIVTSDPLLLRTLVQVLALPPSVKGSHWARSAVFRLLFEVLSVVRSRDLRAANAGNLQGTRAGGGDAGGGGGGGGGSFDVGEDGVIAAPSNLLNNYIVMVLFAVVECGLIQTLTHLGMGGDKDFSSVATSLLTEVLRLSSALLPRTLCARLLSLSPILTQAACFQGDATARVRALDMLTTLGDGGDNRGGGGWRANRGDGSERGDAAVAAAAAAALSDFGGGDTAPGAAKKARVYGIRLDSLCRRSDVASSLPASSSTQERIVKHVRYQFESNMDETELTTLMKRTNVLSTKDWREWDWDLVLELLEGPLTTSQSLIVALKTKLIKRLLSFLKPYKHSFVDLPWTPGNMVYVKVACQLFRVLVDCQEGRDYFFFKLLVDEVFALLLELVAVHTDATTVGGKRPRPSALVPPGNLARDLRNGFVDGAKAAGGLLETGLSSIRNSLMIGSDNNNNGGDQSPRPSPRRSPSSRGGSPRLTPQGGNLLNVPPPRIGRSGSSARNSTVKHPSISMTDHYVKTHLAREYFTLIGILSGTSNGNAFFLKHNFYDRLYALSPPQSSPVPASAACDFLQRQVIASLDYSKSRPARTLLETWVKAGSSDLRLFVCSHLRLLARRSIAGFWQWGVGILASQLTHRDNGGAVALAALSVLDEVCSQSSECMSLLIRKRPSFAAVGAAAQALQLRFLQRSSGLAYLQETGWIQRQLDAWFDGGGNDAYVRGLEESLVAVLNKPTAAAAAAAAAATQGSGGAGDSKGGSKVAKVAAQGTRLLRAHRSVGDDYIFDRVHHLPWMVTASLESPKGVSTLLSTDAFVHTSPVAAAAASVGALRTTAGDGDAGDGGKDGKYLATGLHTRIKANVLGTVAVVDGMEYTVDSDDDDDDGDNDMTIALSLHRGRTTSDDNESGGGGGGGGGDSSRLAQLAARGGVRVDSHASVRVRVSVGGANAGDVGVDAGIDGPGRGGGKLSSSSSSSPSSAIYSLRGYGGGVLGGGNSSPRGGSTPRGSVGVGVVGGSGSGGGSGGVSAGVAVTAYDIVCTPEHRAAAAQQQQQARARGIISAAAPNALTVVVDGVTFLFTATGLPSVSPSMSQAYILRALDVPVQMPQSTMPAAPLPPHLYSALCATQEGCDLVRASGHVERLLTTLMGAPVTATAAADDDVDDAATTAAAAASIADGGGGLRAKWTREAAAKTAAAAKAAASSPLDAPSHSPAALVQRSALWAIGHIGSSGFGFSLLMEKGGNIVAYISHQATHCATLSMRGTCFYILGLMSRSRTARAHLSDLGWLFAQDANATIVVPRDVAAFLRVPAVPYVGSWASDTRNVHGLAKTPATQTAGGEKVESNDNNAGPERGHECKLILGHVSNLGNHVTQKASLGVLRRLRNKPAYQQFFKSPVLLLEAMKLISSYGFRLPARRFILFDLFSQVEFTAESIRAFDTAGDAVDTDALETLGVRVRGPLAGSPRSSPRSSARSIRAP